MSKVATRTAYGKALAELIVERDDSDRTRCQT